MRRRFGQFCACMCEVEAMSDVFISHSSKDKWVAEKVCIALHGRGINFWIAFRDSRGIFAGKIIEAIDEVKGLILIFS